MIATIVLDINGVKIELTRDQAKELYKLLGSLSGKDTVEYVPVPYQVPVYPAQPYPVPVYPAQPYPVPYRIYPTWTCTTSDTTATLTLSNTEA